MHVLVIDTEDAFLSTGLAAEVARAAGGRHYALPHATDTALSAAASGAMAQVREAAAAAGAARA